LCNIRFEEGGHPLAGAGAGKVLLGNEQRASGGIQRSLKWQKVQRIERQSVLPPELLNHFVNDAFWRAPEANIHGVPIFTPKKERRPGRSRCRLD
jgi:hypothetical protein